MQKVNNFTKKMIINNSITIQCIFIAKRQYEQKKKKNESTVETQKKCKNKR